MFFRIGVDVGGTNTDSAILDVRAVKEESRGVLATCKTSTTPNVTEGIANAIESVLAESKVPRDQILNVAIGTTHFVNAVVEGDARRLSRVATVRLCGPYTKKNPPFSDMPYALRDVIEGPHFYLDGGLEIDGREIRPLNVEQIKATAAAIYEAGIRSVAVVGVFSALDHEGKHEERCKALMLQEYPDVSIVCSHTIGGPGLLARENATILNASILSFAHKTMQGFERAMDKLGLRCPLYITQNDGTLMDAATAALAPVKTFASGPTNSLMGAAFLEGLDLSNKLHAEEQIIVVDIGGTTTDVCALLPSGFPRQAANFVEVGGVRTAFSMPEVLSIGLGGGSRVKLDTTTNKVSVGPGSVAHRLTQDAMTFGGNTMTATDIIVSDGGASIGDAKLVASIPDPTIKAAKAEIKRLLEKAIDGMKVSSAPVVVLLVGGGSIILTEELAGVSRCLRPPHHDSANAVGAAIAKVAGEVDIIEVLAGRDEDSVVEAVKQRAIDAAIAKGASKEDVRLVEVKKIPLQYVTNKATRLVMKAVGSLVLPDPQTWKRKEAKISIETNGGRTPEEEVAKSDMPSIQLGSMTKPTLGTDLSQYRPDVRGGIWHVSPIDVELIAVGTGILGTGGGGSSYNMALFVLDILRKGGNITVIPPSSLRDSDICVFGAGYGAPSVSDERIPSGDEVFAAIDGLNTVLGHKEFQGIVADEIGGGNGLVTFPSSAFYQKPVVDCDLMGRAYPTMEHGTPYVYGHPITPCSTADGKGNVAVVVSAESNSKVESLLRTACIEMGNSTAVAGRPLTGDVIRDFAVPNTLSQSFFLGRAVHLARQTKLDFIKAINEVTPVKLLYTGKIVDVTRDVSRGYTMGRCLIAPLSGEEDESEMNLPKTQTGHMSIPFQNEYLAAFLVDADGKSAVEETVCIVPDLISILGQDGEALGSPELRYGLKVRVIAMPAHPLWTGSEQGLKVGGPEFFGLGTSSTWKSIGKYKLPKSVFDVFGQS
jgi:N-methylhydantoinase A/oxoprolinase/acetone carboxylase beta subunit/DUF917 family protein